MPPDGDRSDQSGLRSITQPLGRCRCPDRGCRSAGDPAEVGHAEVDGAVVDMGELGFGASQADLEALDLAEPAFRLGFGDSGAGTEARFP
ncbi:hypothetical protein ACWD3J_45880 [Streptomyces sp. NPDC002755]|uniref:hypothetical protein n=1 Tax=Streptomyces sp. NPDC002884 TaxID=3154544 RepID=UPI003325A2FB